MASGLLLLSEATSTGGLLPLISNVWLLLFQPGSILRETQPCSSVFSSQGSNTGGNAGKEAMRHTGHRRRCAAKPSAVGAEWLQLRGLQ